MTMPRHPAFTKWLAAQTRDVDFAVRQKAAAIATDPSICPTHRHAQHAANTLLTQWCAANHGYAAPKK